MSFPFFPQKLTASLSELWLCEINHQPLIVPAFISHCQSFLHPSEKSFLLAQPPIYHHFCHLMYNFIALQLLQGLWCYIDFRVMHKKRETEPLQSLVNHPLFCRKQYSLDNSIYSQQLTTGDWSKKRIPGIIWCYDLNSLSSFPFLVTVYMNNILAL